MELEDFTRLLLSLGFVQVERGKLLTHTMPVPSIYLNRRRDGLVYFTAYARDGHRYQDRGVWAQLPPQQSKDADPKFVTVVPLSGKEQLAFQTLLEQK